MAITEKEFAIIKEISAHQKPTQRHLAQQVNISLGLTNLTIKRLIKKGYIKIHEAPPRTIVYSLTPKGLAEKTKKSYQFMLKTIGLMKSIRTAIEGIIMEEYEKGVRDFEVVGAGELSDFAEIAFRDIGNGDIRYARKTGAQARKTQGGCYLISRNSNLINRIDIIRELANRGIEY